MARQADFRFGVGWMLFGAALLAASWRMDRLESLHINPWSAPGLLPGLLGLLILVFGAALCGRGTRGELSEEESPVNANGRVVLALGLSIAFAAGLLGRGLPFWLTSSAYLFFAFLAFRWLDREPEASFSWIRTMLASGAIAVLSSVALAALFERVFLVRLP